MDPLTKLLQRFSDWIGNLSEPAESLILRSLLFFGITTGLAAWAFHRGSRSSFIQILSVTLGMALASMLPVHWLVPENDQVRFLVLLLSLVTLVFLPSLFPRYLTPSPIWRRRIGRAAYGFLAILFLSLAWS